MRRQDWILFFCWGWNHNLALQPKRNAEPGPSSLIQNQKRLFAVVQYDTSFIQLTVNLMTRFVFTVYHVIIKSGADSY